ncbi:LacI family DNA-binding transcriptional regulator [uncultured Victivallis sp.]|mgnify:FL=1|uniref:LacI family DNA-binding transcriptional regulator n=1 Tax=uncultured Victivallis sp. TaxID=354118 RepID=UPI0025EA00EA|nr:LacI family DNA-binding transcriptional regulator [uncultured Victivallis sp.]
MSPVRKTTLRDIAANLGISISQASRALNRKPDVAPEIREKVLALAKKLNYRNTSGKHVKTIGVLVPWFQYSFDAFVDEIITQTRQRKLHMIIFPRNDVPALDSQLIDGALAVGERISSEWGRQHNIPLVVINNFGWVLDNVSSVMPDADGESRQALEHLIALGHRKIARLRGPVSTDRERNRGLDEFYRIAGQYGIRESVRNICASSPEEMEMHLRTLLDEGFTAFILIPIEWISRCVKTIRDSGREIPRDVSLIVYEETSVTPFQSPPLTAFAIDYSELVRNALDQLLLEINGEKGESQIVVPTRLILRESTGPCPSAPQ